MRQSDRVPQAGYLLAAILAAVLMILPGTAFATAADSQKATLSGDFDGVPGLEIASITGTTVKITSTATGSVRYYQIGNWRFAQQAELDGQPGNELLFTNLLTINGFGQPAQAIVLSDRAREVRTYSLGRPNRLQIVELDGQSGSELLATNLLTINGFGQPAQAAVVTHRSRDLRIYDVGRPNSLRLAELEGEPGSELLFTNLLRINGVPQPAQATVITQRLREVRTYNVGQAGDLELVELEGQPGDEVLFTGILIINGLGQPAKATVLTHRVREARTYDVGRPNRFRLAELEGQPGKEVLFTNLLSINGFPQPARATVLTHRNRDVVTYDVGRPNNFQLAELEGQPGDEVFFTNLMRINGVPQQASASVITHWRRRVQIYNVGRPLSSLLSDLDGFPGNELAFVGDTSLMVITPSLEEVQPYSIGSWSSFQMLNADGAPGNELLFRLRDRRSLLVTHRTRSIRIL